ncbi:MAG: SDR family NAD(P)-dependent oxidoreductase [Bradymonadia bacterium]
MKQEKQQTVLVTGASQGIGASVARAFAEQGYSVVLCARNLSKLEALAAEIGGHAYALDVADGTAVTQVLDQVEREVGPIDILVSNAGVAVSATLTETTDEDWAKMLGVNLTGGFYLCRRVLPGMAERGFGRIIFIASNAGLMGYPYTSGYCASKHGTIGLMRSLAAEYARENLTVNAICPGFVETEMAQGAIDNIERRTGRSAEKARAALERLNPQRRLIQCDEVAHLALSLGADGARGINGQAIALDGGQVQH